MGHGGDTPSASDITVGKKKRTIKFPCLLCKGDHYSHLFPRMDEASYLLENIQLPTGYQNISPKPSLVDGLVNIVPFPLSLVDRVAEEVDIGGHPPFPTGPKQFSGNFGNLLFLAVFHFRSRFEALNDVFWENGLQYKISFDISPK
jgi:hypothetical protein